MARFAARARRGLRRSGVKSVPREPTALHRANLASLTASQLDVLALLLEGLTNAELADRLVVSPRPSTTMVSASLRKLGASTAAMPSESPGI